jgi:hypothetical protein
LNASTIFFASRGNRPSSTKAPISPGERIPAGASIAGVHVHDRPRQHPDLAYPVEGGGADRRQSQRQVDDEERHRGDQPQGEQVERPLALDAFVNRAQGVAEALPHPVAQHEAAGEKGERGADAGGEGHDHGAPQQTEDRPRDERHQRRAGQRKPGHGHVDEEESEHGLPRVRRVVVQDRGLLRLEVVEAQVAVASGGEERRRQNDDEQGDCDPRSAHVTISASRSARCGA